MRPEELTSCERAACDASRCGDKVDFGDVRVSGLQDPELGAKWGPERVLRPSVLVELVATKRPFGEPAAGVLTISRARIVEPLDLRDLHFCRPLVLDGCFFDDDVRLDGATAPRLEFRQCRIPFLTARQFATTGDFVLDRLTGARGLDLTGARIGGVLALRGAAIANPHGVAIDASWIEVHTEIDGRHLEAIGEVKLLGAQIGGVLRLGGARLRNQGLAVRADGLNVRHLTCCPIDSRRCEVEGEFRMLGAHLGWIDFDGASLTNENGPALSADGVHVDHDINCGVSGAYSFEAIGGASLISTRVGGGMYLVGARLENAGGYALSADGLRVEGDFFCRESDPVEPKPPLVDENGPHPVATAADPDTDIGSPIAGAQPFRALGGLSLIGARIGGTFDLTGAILANDRGYAILGDGLRVNADLLCREAGGNPFEATGEVRLLQAEVTGSMSFDGARLANSEGMSLNLEAAKARDLQLPQVPPRGLVDLTNAVVGRFDDSRRAGDRGADKPYLVRIRGFVYDSLDPMAWVDRCRVDLPGL